MNPRDGKLSSMEESLVAEQTEKPVPYYLENFWWIVDSVYRKSEFRHLFASPDGVHLLKTIEKFESLEINPKKLYVRLFLRKLNWLQRSKIRYEELGSSDDIDRFLDVLCKEGFITDKISGTTLDELAPFLNLTQIKELGKQFRIDCAKGSASKSEIISQLKKKCNQQRTPFGLSLAQLVCKKAVALLGKIYRVDESHRKIFMRAMNLIQLTAGISSIVGQSPIYGLLQLNLGNLVFPTFSVKTSRNLFSSLVELEDFETARLALDEIMELQMSRNYGEIKRIYQLFLPKWEAVIENEKITKRVADCPLYLRKFTIGYQLTKIMENGIEALEKLDEKSDAINGYMQLLEQAIYVPHHRGDWYNRLTILMLKIDKNPDAAAKMLLRGIADETLREHQRLELRERLKRISKRVQAGILKEINGNKPEVEVRKAISVEIRGKLCATENMGKGKTVFLDSRDDTLVCSVEELALSHYKEQGFSEGAHVEGSLISSIYGILFWDVIYDDSVSDVFRSTLQAAPLDLHCPTFWTSRLTLISVKLAEISSSNEEQLSDLIASVWEKNHQYHSPAVFWDLFSSVEYLQNLIRCFTPIQLSAICERFARNYGAVRAGFPDLTLWNPETRTLKIVEVKGPNDRLSFKQILWIDFLMKIDVPVEVCHVVASGSKRKTMEQQEID